jgi:hypothetical protein
MIKINLLPAEKRKAERTPLPRFGLMMADVAVLGVVLLLVIISFVQIGYRNTEIKVKNEQLESLQPDVKKHDALLADVNRMSGELASLKKVTDQRPFEWWKVFDAVWDVVQTNQRVWLDSIDLVDAKQAESKLKAIDPETQVKPSYGVILKCHVGGLDVKGLTGFRMDLKNNEYLQKMFPTVNFDTQWLVSEQKDFLEKYSLDFEVLLVNTGQKDEGQTNPAAARKAP